MVFSFLFSGSAHHESRNLSDGSEDDNLEMKLQCLDLRGIIKFTQRLYSQHLPLFCTYRTAHMTKSVTGWRLPLGNQLVHCLERIVHFIRCTNLCLVNLLPKVNTV
jgi:hypothetical protein